jgi:hypothetical protein
MQWREPVMRFKHASSPAHTKTPAIVEAVQWRGTSQYDKEKGWLGPFGFEIQIGNNHCAHRVNDRGKAKSRHNRHMDHVLVLTRVGATLACPGDWITKTVSGTKQGFFDTFRPEVFKKKFKRA